MTFWTDLANTPYRIDWIEANGLRTRFLEAGAHHQDTVLFLHGVAGHLETFVRNVAAHAQHFRVLAMDMIGHGYSAKPAHDYELHHYVAHVIGLLDALGVARTHLIGTSLGGWTAARVAAQHPGRVGRLVLASTAGLTASPAVMNSIRTLSTDAALANTKEAVRKRLEWVIHDPAQVSDDLLEARWRIYNQPEYQAVIRHLMCLQDPAIRQRNLLSEAELGRITAPTLVVWTGHDPTGDAATGQRYARAIPGARFEMFEDSSHMPQFEEPERFNALVTRFLRGKAAD